MQPILSLIVPSYNMEDFLPSCLDSVLVGNPLSDQVEILVVNDGSTDRTGEIAHKYQEKYPTSVRIIDKRNGNYGSCINAALPLVSGAYVKILDSDDSFETHVFEQYLSFLESFREGDRPDVVINDFVEVDPTGSVTRQRTFGMPDDCNFTLSSMVPMEGRTLWMHALAYRSDFIKRIDYHQLEGISYTDQQWVAIPILFANTFRRFPKPVYRYLVGRPGQTVDPEVKLRNFEQHLPVQRAIIEAYVHNKQRLSQDTERFVREHIQVHLIWIYREYLLGHPFYLEDSKLSSFDLFLLQKDMSLANTVDNLSFSFTRWKIRFHFVREWRRTHCRRTVKFRIFYMVLRLRNTWHRFVERR